jgi:hypothetical protein
MRIPQPPAQGVQLSRGSRGLEPPFWSTPIASKHRRSSSEARDLGVTGPRVSAAISPACVYPRLPYIQLRAERMMRYAFCPSRSRCSDIPSRCADAGPSTSSHKGKALREGPAPIMSELRERLCAVDTFTPHPAHIYKTALRPRAMAAEHSPASCPRTGRESATPKIHHFVASPPSSPCRVL